MRDVDKLFIAIMRFRRNVIPKIPQLLQLELNTITKTNIEDINKYIEQCGNIHKNLAQLNSNFARSQNILENLRAPKRSRNRHEDYQKFHGIKGGLNDKLARLKKHLGNLKIDLRRININPKLIDRKIELEVSQNLGRFLNAHNNEFTNQLRTHQQVNQNTHVNNIENPYIGLDIVVFATMVFVLTKKLTETISKLKD